MLNISFYKGVPLDNLNENVLCLSREDREEFLSNYQISTPVIIKKFAFNGVDSQSFLTVSLLQEPFKINYIKVYQSLKEPDTDIITERVLFFFVNGYKQGAENSVELSLTIDNWNTYFENEENKTIIRPLIKNALCIQGHGWSNGEINEIPPISNSISTIIYSSLSNKTKSRLVLHLNVTDVGECCFISKTLVDYGEAVQQIFLLANCINANITYNLSTGGRITKNFNQIDAYLIPDELFTENSTNYLNNYNLCDCYFTSENNVVETINFYMANKQQNASGIIISNAVVVHPQTFFEITPQAGELTLVGTGKTNVELPYNSKTYNVYFNLCCSNDLSIEMIVNKQRVALTDDYRINLIYSDYTNFVANSKNVEQLRSISSILGSAGSFIGLGTSLASGNISGALTSGLGLAVSGINYFTGEAKLQDLKNQPPKLTTNLENIGILYHYRGLGKFVATCIEKENIINFDNYFGFKMNAFKNSIDISQHENNERFKFIKCSEIQIIGNFNYSIREYLENLFKRGIRVWYSKDHFLDSINQKI